MRERLDKRWYLLWEKFWRHSTIFTYLRSNQNKLYIFFFLENSKIEFNFFFSLLTRLKSNKFLYSNFRSLQTRAISNDTQQKKVIDMLRTSWLRMNFRMNQKIKVKTRWKLFFSLLSSNFSLWFFHTISHCACEWNCGNAFERLFFW